MNEGRALPQVELARAQRIRLIVVGILCALALIRVGPDVIRAIYPLGIFPYVTDFNGTVTSLKTAKGGPSTGDRVRIDLVPAVDRKPGLAGVAWTYDDTPRRLPFSHNGKVEKMHLDAVREGPGERFLVILRVVLAFITVGLGAMLFLVRPQISTAAFFVSTIGIPAPATYLDWLMPLPWREIDQGIGIFLHSIAAPALLLFVFCLIDGDDDAPRERLAAWICGGFALILAATALVADLGLTYYGRQGDTLHAVVRDASIFASALTAVLFIVAYTRAHGKERRTIAGIASAFLISIAAQLTSDAFFPRYIPVWVNSVLISASTLPVIAVWIAVVRERFFAVNFIERRAVVYVALTAGVVGTIAAIEDVGTYVFYSNTDLQYGFLIIISIGLGAMTGKIKGGIEKIVDRFIFRERAAQRVALEFLAYRMLEADDHAAVERALLLDARDALDLSFCGIFRREPDGAYTLTDEIGWPEGLQRRLEPGDTFAAAIARSRGVLSFSGADAAAVREHFPGGKLAFAAPIFTERKVGAIVVYGPNVGGRDLDPHEHELLVRVIAHATVALHDIEMQHLRTLLAQHPLPG